MAGRRGQMGGQTPRAAGVLMAASVVLRGSPLPKFCVGPGPAPSAWVGHLSRIPTAHDPDFRVPCSRPSSNSLPRGGLQYRGHVEGPSTIPEGKREGTDLGRQAGWWGMGWMEEEAEAGGAPPPLPPSGPLSPEPAGPQRGSGRHQRPDPAAGSGDSAAICYLMRR